MNCIIIDDDKLSRSSLAQMVSQVPLLKLKGEFNSAMEALPFIMDKTADVLLLDIEMPDLSGLELIRTLKNPPITILITSKPDYAIEEPSVKIEPSIVTVADNNFTLKVKVNNLENDI